MKIHGICLFVLSGVLLGEAQDTCGDFVKTLDDFTVQRYFLESDTGFENDLSCSWTLKAANSGSRIAYQLTDINLGSDDYINAYAGTSDFDTNVVSNHSGIGSSINVQSVNSPNIHVTLQTGSVKQTTRQSFDGYYMAGSDQSGTVSCVNQTLVATAVPQFLTSPGFPDNYPTSKKCSWSITSPESATLELTFHMIDIEEGDSSTICNYDGLVVYRPGQKDTPEFLVCRRGVWVSETHPMSTNEIQLDFTSDGSDAYGGFVLSYKANLPPTTTTKPTPTTEEITTDSSGCNNGSDGETTTSQNSDGETATSQNSDGEATTSQNYDDQSTNSDESGSSDINPSEGGLSVSITNDELPRPNW
ncbi:procollagen C-endopeptidase enhancer 2-like isoform X3 [Argopecten irradians]|uniref:procollagen C-endopeptidase enhancer 2-like isoform X3 n=1 Tax=Argopecten irradians TaxID=31199 RepID=UPI003718A867